jgi:hypothetical protein
LSCLLCFAEVILPQGVFSGWIGYLLVPKDGSNQAAELRVTPSPCRSSPDALSFSSASSNDLAMLVCRRSCQYLRPARRSGATTHCKQIRDEGSHAAHDLNTFCAIGKNLFETKVQKIVP